MKKKIKFDSFKVLRERRNFFQHKQIHFILNVLEIQKEPKIYFEGDN